MANTSNRELLANYLRGTQDPAKRNYIINPSGHKNLSGIVATGATVARNTTNPLTSISDVQATFTAAGQTVDFQATPIDRALYNSNCELRFHYKLNVGSGSNVQVHILDGTNALLIQDLTPESSNRPVSINFPCSNSGNAMSVRFTQNTGSNTSTLNVANLYLGQATNVGTVAQAELVGTIRVSGCSGYWNSTSSSWSNFSPLSGCTYTTTGSILPPTTNIPGFRLVNQKSGKYVFRFIGAAGQMGVSSTICLFRFSDGINNSEMNYISIYNGAHIVPILGGNIIYNQAIQDNTIQIQLIRASGSAQCIISASGTDSNTIEVYRYPLDSEIAVRPETQNVYGGVKYISNTTDISSSGVATNTRTILTVTNLQNIASYIGAAKPCSDPNQMCIRFENLPAGDYLVKATGYAEPDVEGTDCFFSINDISLSSVPPESRVLQSSGTRINTTIHNYFSYNSVGTREFAVYARRYNGTANCRIGIGTGSTSWAGFVMELIPLSNNRPAPLLVGSVTSNSADALRIESVEISDCIGAGTICSIAKTTSDWIQQIQRSPTYTGEYLVTYKPNIFKSPPICWCTAGGSQIIGTLVFNDYIVLRNTSGPVDGRFIYTCIGIKGSS